jgi:hypothetical protein
MAELEEDIPQDQEKAEPEEDIPQDLKELSVPMLKDRIEARLPPMIPYDKLSEKERLTDMKEFRKYLVETGTAACLVKLYKHIAKNEMRLDNHSILKEFFETHNEETDATREADRLSEENDGLRETNAELQARVDALTKEVSVQQRRALGKTLWHKLVEAEFWDGTGSAADLASGLPLSLLFQRFCGQKVDKATDKILVNLLRPSSLSETEASTALPIDLEGFSTWMANDISEDLHVWCRDDLLARCDGEDKTPPYENDVIEAIKETSEYPKRLNEVADTVDLEPSLLNLFAFLEAVAVRFRGDA